MGSKSNNKDVKRTSISVIRIEISQDATSNLVEAIGKWKYDCVVQTMNGMGQLDREDILVFSERDTREHGRELRSTTCSRYSKKFSFPC